MNHTATVILDPDKVYEVVNGEPEEKEMGGARHGGVGLRLGSELWSHVKPRKLGRIYGADTSFRIGENDRIPDVAFVVAERMPASGEPEGTWLLAPDLAVEVVSPNDLFEKLHGKIREYFEAGVRQVWVVSPEQKTVALYRSPTLVQVLTGSDELVCEELFPGLRLPLAELFL